MKVSIIIVHYGPHKLLQDCLDSLDKQTYKDYEVLIKYNNLDNVGFAEGNNIKIREAKGEYIVLLNNDTKVHKDWLKELVKTADRDEWIGMVSPKIIKPDKSIDTLGIRMTIYGMGHNIKHNYDIGRLMCPCGASALYRKEALENVKQGEDYLDKDFFMYSEDTDLGLRLKNKGWKVAHSPKAIVTHIGGGSTDNAKYYDNRNNVFLAIKNYPLWKLILQSPFILTAQFGSIIIYTIRRKPKLILRAKRDAIKMIPKMWKKRQR